MKILITGGNGMLGRALQSRLRNHIILIADLPDIDITQPNSILFVTKLFHPDIIIHTAAMKSVDLCESESDKAYLVNAIGSSNVALAAYNNNSRLIAISTDYVFDGSLDRPYHEWDHPNPKTVYGSSKLAGEDAIRIHCPNHVIVRTSWLYGKGGPSFVHTMLELGNKVTDTPIKVVGDQIGNPTSTDVLVDVIEKLFDVPYVGTVHVSCDGYASWYDFAEEIFIQRPTNRSLVSCTTSEFFIPAPRPANSRLEKRVLRLLGFPPMKYWKDALNEFLSNPI